MQKNIKCELCNTITSRDFENLNDWSCTKRAICPVCIPESENPDSSPLWEDDNWVAAAMTPHTPVE